MKKRLRYQNEHKLDIDPANLTEAQMDRIAERFATVQECDRICRERFVANRWALHKTIEWSTEASPLMRRAAFVLMATLAEGENGLRNHIFYAFLPILERACCEEQDPLVTEAIAAAWLAVARRNDTLRGRVQERMRELAASGRCGWIMQVAEELGLQFGSRAQKPI